MSANGTKRIKRELCNLSAFGVKADYQTVTPDFQLDMRAGVGLNHASNDFLAGLRFAARY